MSPNVTKHLLKDGGTYSNNEKLPLLAYKGALASGDCDPAKIEHLLENHSWGSSWRNSVYPYHHYHSTAHEVLVVCSGSAKVQFGSEDGVVLKISLGDAVVIPAGVAHKKLEANQDFRVVGAYPLGQSWDMNYGKPGERPKADENIAAVPLPKADPLYEEDGPLMQNWQATS